VERVIVAGSYLKDNQSKEEAIEEKENKES